MGTHSLDKYINQEEIKRWMEEDPERKDVLMLSMLRVVFICLRTDGNSQVVLT